MADYKKLYEEEKSKSRIWMIVSIVSILIGLILLIIVGYLAMTRHPMPKCNCFISETDLENVSAATDTLKNFKHKVKGLAHINSDCNPLDVTSSCLKPQEVPQEGLFARKGLEPRPRQGLQKAALVPKPRQSLQKAAPKTGLRKASSIPKSREILKTPSSFPRSKTREPLRGLRGI